MSRKRKRNRKKDHACKAKKDHASPLPPAPRRPAGVTNLCPECKGTEAIPAAVVLHFDLFDEGDPAFPPRFQCPFGCDILMTPLRYAGIHGYTYITDHKTGVCRFIPSAPPPD